MMSGRPLLGRDARLTGTRGRTLVCLAVGPARAEAEEAQERPQTSSGILVLREPHTGFSARLLLTGARQSA